MSHKTRTYSVYTPSGLSLSGVGSSQPTNAIFHFFRSCILYYIKFNTLFNCLPLPVRSLEAAILPKKLKIDSEARFDGTFFNQTHCMTLRMAHYLAEMVYSVHTLHFFLTSFRD